MEALVALQIAMGLCNKPAISDYWSKVWLTRVKFSDVMPRNRYENLLCSAFRRQQPFTTTSDTHLAKISEGT